MTFAWVALGWYDVVGKIKCMNQFDAINMKLNLVSQQLRYVVAQFGNLLLA
jgi:hypothetical protein